MQYKIFFSVVVFLSTLSHAQSPTIESVKEAVQKNYPDCIYLGYLYTNKNTLDSSWVMCIHKHTEVRGIFAASACVVTLIDAKDQKREPYYGKNGHWGIEGACTAANLRQKILEKKTFETENPITKIQELHRKGAQYITFKNYGNMAKTMDKVLLAPSTK